MNQMTGRKRCHRKITLPNITSEMWITILIRQWVRIFYQGNVLSIGWEELSEGVLVELPDAKKTEYEKRMFTLGQRIGAEWALDNSVRLIDTRSASVWSDALLEAIYLKELEAFIFKMENDVDSILTGRLNKNEIAFTRYYDEEEIEFF